MKMSSWSGVVTKFSVRVSDPVAVAVPTAIPAQFAYAGLLQTCVTSVNVVPSVSLTVKTP